MSLAAHRSTPSLNVIDGRGLSVRRIEYLREDARALMAPLITRAAYDAAGRLTEQRDPRLAEAPRPNLASVQGLAGQSIKVDSVDAGWRLHLAGAGGEVLQRWDARGNQWRTTYDDLRRTLTVDENDQANVEVYTYGRGDADAQYNLRGQLSQKVAPALTTLFESFSLHNLPFGETRRLAQGGEYTTAWSYAGNGQPLSQTDAGGHRQFSRYDIAGQLKQVSLQILDDGPVEDILKAAHYNAEGQRIEQLAGNGVVSRYHYDAADGRLKRMQTGVPGQALRQDLEYFYDRVGNVQRLEDHTFQVAFFANQRIDGQREFTYDSLYRLLSATGHDACPAPDHPGHPSPSDPNNHLNYTQHYEYDTSGNLQKLIHLRAIGGYTRHMFIDPASNRGVRWSEDEPAPDFASLFDPHGNLQALQPGQDLQWNTADQLAAVSLIKRENLRDDEEIYSYSEGARIYKRLETHTASTTHFHEVIYLPGLEIRKRDNGEELHVITLPSGAGSVRCLHWASGKPGAIDADQLRYSVDDHLGSSLMELDRQARLISHEGYYPFGGTAWLTADSALQASYKTIRYSGKEMDVTGLYYYGMRYYAPWLQRWISADPAGDVDGLNLYAMVGNNPVTFLDVMGLVRGDHLHKMVSDRTTAIVTGANRHPLELVKGRKYTVKAKAEAQQAHEAQYPDSRFTTSYKDKTLIAHAGAAVNASSSDETLYITDNFNITKNEDTLSLQAHGVHMHRPADSSLARDHAANGGILKFDPQRYVNYLSDLYVERFNDKTLPVAIYQGPTSQSQTMAGLEYETAPIHELMANRITGHIAAAENLLPKDFRLPGAHAEVQAANLALHFQKRELGSVDPAQIDVVTQKLQRVVAATDFPACFNCTQILLNAYDNTSPFNVLTGKTDMTHSKWNSAVLEYR